MLACSEEEGFKVAHTNEIKFDNFYFPKYTKLIFSTITRIWMNKFQTGIIITLRTNHFRETGGAATEIVNGHLHCKFRKKSNSTRKLFLALSLKSFYLKKIFFVFKIFTFLCFQWIHFKICDVIIDMNVY